MMRREVGSLFPGLAVGVFLLCMSGVSVGGEGAVQSTSPREVVFDGPLGNVVLADQKPGEHRIWVNDWAGAVYSRAILFDADSGDMLGAVETGWEGVKLDLPVGGEHIYSSALYMSRGYHGERTDALEYINRATLRVEGEIILPPKSGRGLPNTNHSNLSDDESFLFQTFFTPASSVGVVDLRSKTYIGEIETAGCAYVMSAGPRRFFSLCGDGSALAIEIDDTGREARRKRYGGLFDPQADPISGTAVRSGDRWYLVTHLGQVHAIDVGGQDLAHKVLWSATEKAASGKTWIPSEIYQNLAMHRAQNRLYILMGEQDLTPKGGGTDYHRKVGTEIWVFDVGTGKRLQQIKLSQPMTAIAVSQDERPLLYAANGFSTDVLVMDVQNGEVLRTLHTGFHGMPMILQPVEPR